MPTAPRQFWIGVVSREHVRLGVKGGFIQLGHGKKAPLQRLHAGDVLVMYSPRTAYPDGEPLQAFTAMGVVSTGKVYQVQMTEAFKPYRVDVRFLKANEAPIEPLIGALLSSRAKHTGVLHFASSRSRYPPKISSSSPKRWALSQSSKRMRSNSSPNRTARRRRWRAVRSRPVSLVR